MFIKMKKNDSFSTDCKFYAREHFPYGIGRSGEFTCEQSDLLANYGQAYVALAEGSRDPLTAEEERFVAVCQGKLKARSCHEKAWLLFLSKTQPRRSTYSSLVSVGNQGAVDFAENGYFTEI